jgi:hypothetical protein
MLWRAEFNYFPFVAGISFSDEIQIEECDTKLK